MKPLALIYGHDGFDPDVNLNLRSFYSQLGYRVHTSRKLIESKLLVISRTPNFELDLSNYSHVHIYDYVCNDNFEFMKSIQDHPGIRVFSPSENRMTLTLAAAPYLFGKIFVMLPPVVTSIWSNPPNSEYRFKTIHIGNFKSSLDSNPDKISADFLKFLKKNEVEIWGDRWKGHVANQSIHGRVSLLSAPNIYRSAKFAVGIMYPYQRNLTISGRFWMAPLNGAKLFSEPNSQIQNIPGVFESDFRDISSDDELDFDFRSKVAVFEEARKYWDDRYIRSQKFVAELIGQSDILNKKKRLAKKNIVERAIVTQESNFRQLKYLMRLD